MSGFNSSTRQIASFLMALAVLWALAEGVPVWLIAAIVLPPVLFAAFSSWTERRPPTEGDE